MNRWYIEPFISKEPLRRILCKALGVILWRMLPTLTCMFSKLSFGACTWMICWFELTTSTMHSTNWPCPPSMRAQAMSAITTFPTKLLLFAPVKQLPATWRRHTLYINRQDHSPKITKLKSLVVSCPSWVGSFQCQLWHHQCKFEYFLWWPSHETTSRLLLSLLSPQLPASIQRS